MPTDVDVARDRSPQLPQQRQLVHGVEPSDPLAHFQVGDAEPLQRPVGQISVVPHVAEQVRAVDPAGFP